MSPVKMTLEEVFAELAEQVGDEGMLTFTADASDGLKNGISIKGKHLKRPPMTVVALRALKDGLKFKRIEDSK